MCLCVCVWGVWVLLAMAIDHMDSRQQSLTAPPQRLYALYPPLTPQCSKAALRSLSVCIAVEFIEVINKFDLFVSVCECVCVCLGGRMNEPKTEMYYIFSAVCATHTELYVRSCVCVCGASVFVHVTCARRTHFRWEFSSKKLLKFPEFNVVCLSVDLHTHRDRVFRINLENVSMSACDVSIHHHITYNMLQLQYMWLFSAQNGGPLISTAFWQ